MSVQSKISSESVSDSSSFPMKHSLKTLLPALTAACLLPGVVQAQTVDPATSLAGSTLTSVITLPDNAITNGVTLTPDAKRIFMVIQVQTGQELPQFAEYVNGALVPFPNAAFNQYAAGQDASNAFVHVNAARFGPDGTLWVVDVGHGIGEQNTVPHAAKLVGFDLATGAVTHVYYFDPVIHENSFVDDVRFDGDYAYLTDAGRPGLIVVHLTDGTMYRALDKQPSTTALRPIFAAGHAAITATGGLFYFHADQLEVTPDGKTLYFEPASGPVSAIDVQYLNDATLPDAERATHVTEHAEIGSTGGSAIDAQGNMYATDVNRGGIVKILPSGKVIPLLYDPGAAALGGCVVDHGGRHAVGFPCRNLTARRGCTTGRTPCITRSWFTRRRSTSGRRRWTTSERVGLSPDWTGSAGERRGGKRGSVERGPAP